MGHKCDVSIGDFFKSLAPANVGQIEYSIEGKGMVDMSNQIIKTGYEIHIEDSKSNTDGINL